jgi:hypothetical protein
MVWMKIIKRTAESHPGIWVDKADFPPIIATDFHPKIGLWHVIFCWTAFVHFLDDKHPNFVILWDADNHVRPTDIHPTKDVISFLNRMTHRMKFILYFSHSVSHIWAHKLDCRKAQVGKVLLVRNVADMNKWAHV